MRKGLVLVLILFTLGIVCACAAGIWAAGEITLLVDHVMPAVVSITAGSSGGSGFFISPEGYVLTNAHVVGSRASASVQLSNGDTLTASVVHKDVDADLAILDVGKCNVPVLRLSSPTTVRVGDEVIAIGSPLNLDKTVTRGIVSGLRQYAGHDAVQTDAAINPGNSGGPLINLKGEVVGVNTFKLNGSQGIAFAIATSEVAKVLREAGIAATVSLDYEGFALQDTGESQRERHVADGTVNILTKALAAVGATSLALALVCGIGAIVRRLRRPRRQGRERYDDVEITLH